MITFYYKLLTNSIFSNKKRLIIAYILFFIAFLILLFIVREEIESKIALLIFMFTCVFGAYKTYKINDFNYLTYNSNLKLYDYYPLERNKICYHETFNKLLLDKINSEELEIESTTKIDNLLLNFNNEFISKLKEYITFGRFNDYFINSKGNKTTGELFYVKYRSCLIKIIKDFINKTDNLENTSDEMNQQFINELTNPKNLNFDTDKGLHYDDNLIIDFLEKIQNETFILDDSTTYKNEQLKIENISNFNFYRVLSNSIEEICKTKLERNEKKELKSFVGIYFKSNENGKLSFEEKFQYLSFTNTENYKNFISILKYLTDLHYLETHNSKLSRILAKCIPENSFPKKVKDRTDSIRQCYLNNNLSRKETNKIDCILQSFLNN